MRKTILLPIIVFATIMLAGIGYAAPACDFILTTTTLGTSASHIRGETVNLNVTITDQGATAGGVDNVTMCNITVSPGTITGTLGFNTADGTNNTWCNATINTLQLRDDTEHTFTMTMYNETQEAVGTCTETYYTDNTIPTCVFDSALTSSSEYPPEQTWTVAGVNASLATIQFGNNIPKPMTESPAGENDTFTYSDRVVEWIYSRVSSSTSDGLNATSCTSLTDITIDSEATATKVALILDEEGKKVAETVTPQQGISTVAIIGLVALVIYLYRKKH